MNADGLDADDERRGDLAVRVAAGDEVEDLRLASRQAESFAALRSASDDVAGCGAKSSLAR